MKLNKEIKKGDKIWLNSTYLSEKEFFIVVKVRKVKTLVEVVVAVTLFHSQREIVMYGHCSSSMLSGYDRKFFSSQDTVYTCDYEIVRKKTLEYENNQKFKEVGMALLKIAKFFKNE